MYKILKGETILGYAEKPNFVTKLDNGCYGCCDKSLIGVKGKKVGYCFDGTVYNVNGIPKLDKTLETITVTEVDGGELLNKEVKQLQADVDYLAIMEGVVL